MLDLITEKEKKLINKDKKISATKRNKNKGGEQVKYACNVVKTASVYPKYPQDRLYKSFLTTLSIFV